jgi:succinoglycan biosynthesis transport protein ExoP
MRRLPPYRGEQAEVVYTPEQYPDLDSANISPNRRRVRIFLSVLISCLLISLSYTWLRPAIYESTATLLVTPPLLDERRSEVSNEQHVELELQFLASHSLLARVHETLSTADSRTDAARLTLSDLDDMLEASPVANTNLVELIARGQEKELLPVVINAWISVYQDAHAASIAVDSASEMTATEQQLDEMRQKVAKKREELDSFRKEYDIVSMERNENRMLKRLSGLTDSLNKSNEEEVAARARLGAIKEAIAAGQPVANEHGKDSLTSLDQRLVEIQEQLKQLELEFTPHYMAIDPQIKGLVRKRDLLLQEIQQKQTAGQQLALAQAEQDLATAHRSVQSLQAQLDEQKQQVMEFTTRFAEHEALQEELLQLETVYREVQNQQLQHQVNHRRQYPQISIKEPAFMPEKPVYPYYLRDSGISVAASVLLGLLVLLLYDFLNRSGRMPGVQQLSPVFVNTPGVPVIQEVRGEQLLAAQKTPALAYQRNRELSVSEVSTLLKAADSRSRLLITLLLSGLSLEEVSAMQVGDLDLSVSELTVTGRYERILAITPAIAAVLSACLPGETPADTPVFADSDGGTLGVEDLAALLACAAHDAGLVNPTEVTPEVLRHTYLAYLARQGMRLSDLEKIAGRMPPTVLAAYAIFSPPGSGMSLDSVERDYPALVELS